VSFWLTDVTLCKEYALTYTCSQNRSLTSSHLASRSYNRYMEYTFLLGVKIIHLVDGADLFNISNLVLGGKAIVTDLFSSLE
jgi:hypothetical protein